MVTLRMTSRTRPHVVKIIASVVLVLSVASQLTAQTSRTGTDKKERLTFHQLFFDETDGQLDLSDYLARGGFIPIPVVVTEPAVGGGLGFMGQFIKWPDSKNGSLTRRTFGGVKTGNGSYGVGYLQSGTTLQGRVRYKFGLGTGKLSIAAYTQRLTTPLDYTTTFKYGFLGSAFYVLPDRRFSTGPLVDIRKTETRLDLPGRHPALIPDLNRTLQTASLGWGFHFDNRDNPLTPTKGVNAFVDVKFNKPEFGADRNYNLYNLGAYYFASPTPGWRFAASGLLNVVDGDAPFNILPSIGNRGVQSSRYQGKQALSTEIEITRRLNARWSVLGFAGFGFSKAKDSNFFTDSGDVFTQGLGLRYLIARKQGLEAGIDVAVGPEDTIVYFQFGHAWGRAMD